MTTESERAGNSDPAAFPRLRERLQAPECYHYADYEAVVVGAGHAGCEAAAALSRLGHRCLLLGMNLDALANLPCNPNIGGTAKGQLVREIDAMGGLMGEAADAACIQFRMLNRSKGPAVLSPRAQVDRRRYMSLMKSRIEALPGVDLRQEEIVRLLFDEEGKIAGVESRFGAVFTCRCLILATGTYLDSRVIIGQSSFRSGPDNLFPARGLSDALRKAGVGLQRFKTGTPVRINLRGVDTARLERQDADPGRQTFSFLAEDAEELPRLAQRPCYLTWTTEATHALIRANLDRSPLFSGIIEGVGPRYCPSIEDKVVRFADKDRHQIFIEPVSEDGAEMYLSGLSTSMPADVQAAMLRTIPGLEKAHIQRNAYAIEYDCLRQGELRRSLELRALPGVFCAGQINGSSGYEEAAAQGLMAGLNAARKLEGKAPAVLDRSQAYIGVLIDDLVNKGTREPYRMMTSRAEYRLLLRQDNADLRLTPIARSWGLVSDTRWALFQAKKTAVEAELARLRRSRVQPSAASSAFLEALGSRPLSGGASLADLLRRPQLNYAKLRSLDPERPACPYSVLNEVEITLKYEGYIELENERIARYRNLEARPIPETFDYGAVQGLRREAREKLACIRPETLGQAQHISGVSPADIAVLMVRLESLRRRGEERA